LIVILMTIKRRGKGKEKGGGDYKQFRHAKAVNRPIQDTGIKGKREKEKEKGGKNERPSWCLISTIGCWLFAVLDGLYGRLRGKRREERKGKWSIVTDLT